MPVMETRTKREMSVEHPHFYLVLEAHGTSDEPPLEDPPEVIELAIVAVDAKTGEVVGDFQRFVRPEVNPDLTPHCVSHTGVSQAQIDASEVFEDVLTEASAWVDYLVSPEEPSASLSDEELQGEAKQPNSTSLSALRTRAVTFGLKVMRDLLVDQIEDEELVKPEWLSPWVNLQYAFGRHFALKGRRSLDEALTYLGLKVEERAKGALERAHHIALILSELIQLDARMDPVSDQNSHYQGSSQEKPGDWRCERCNFLNFARRNFCKDCGHQRPGDHAPAPQAMSFGATQEAKPGDWHCDRCSFMNFARRGTCKNCSAPRPGGAPAPSYDRAPRARGPRMKPGDWRCVDCSFVNFARRDSCKDCGSARPEGTERVSHQGRPGDWSCGGCNYLNFAYRDVCGQCGDAKPEA